MSSIPKLAVSIWSRSLSVLKFFIFLDNFFLNFFGGVMVNVFWDVSLVVSSVVGVSPVSVSVKTYFGISISFQKPSANIYISLID